jgi:NADPH:quinone reductase-like Zn-dependent oxidoreductase
MVTHRAIVQEVPSGPLTLQVVERSVLGVTELLVRVEAVALNVLALCTSS